MKKKVFLYYGLSIFITWGLWLTAMFYATINSISIPYNEGFYTIVTRGFESNRQMFAYIIFALAVYGPLLSSLVLRKKSENTKEEFTKPRAVKLSIKWVAIIIIYPLALFSLGVIFSLITTGFAKGIKMPDLPLWFFPILLIYQTLTSGTEEFGWRGFLQGQLQKSFNAEKACYLVGILWSIWHFPFIIYTNMSGGLTAILMSLVGFVLLTIPQAFVMAFIYNSTKSIILCVFFHAYANTVSFYILAMSPNTQMATIGVAVLTWLVANYLTKKYDKERLSYDLGV